MGDVDVAVEIRKWGDSLAVIIPRSVANEARLHVNDRVRLRLEKRVDVSELFGIIKGKIDFTPQEMKRAAKKGWD